MYTYYKRGYQPLVCDYAEMERRMKEMEAIISKDLNADSEETELEQELITTYVFLFHVRPEEGMRYQ